MTEQENNATGIQVEDMTPDYLAAINELKQNSVDRSKYDQLRAENKKLLDSLVNGQTIQVESQPKPVDIKALRDKIFDKEPRTNLDYISNVLELRQALIDNGEKDPFLPWGNKISPTTEDVECAERVARVFQECIDYAEGDSQLFTNELQRRTIDSGMPRRK